MLRRGWVDDDERQWPNHKFAARKVKSLFSSGLAVFNIFEAQTIMSVGSSSSNCSL
eukprot:m.43822 g.43822  ORF g.43822 m.43822 type:complete len:56 (-) comp7129_c0_seq2:18-185(-)